LDFESIKDELTKLQLNGQSLHFEHISTDFVKCPACAIAWAASRKTFSSTNSVMGEQRTSVAQYISSEELHDQLRTMQSHIPGYVENANNPHVRILPVYVFDLSTKEPMLLDRYHQAQGFPDMVVAVQTQTGQMRGDFRCGDAPVTFNTANAERPVLAALLNGGWGVAATHEAWDPVRNRTATDYLWSVGPTVFGPFSEEKSISFPLRDAAMRSVIFSMVNESIAEVHTFISSFSRYGKEIDEVLPAQQHAEFLRRWNVFKYKLDKASLYVSLHNYEHAMYYLRSLRHDVVALHNIVHIAGKNLHSRMACKKIYTNVIEPSYGWRLLWLLAVGVCCWLLSRGVSRSQVLMSERVKRK